MVQKEAELLVDRAGSWHELGRRPYDKPKHAREASVSNENEKAPYEQWENSRLERVHGVRRKSESEIVEHRRRGKETPSICKNDATCGVPSTYHQTRLMALSFRTP